MARLRWVRGLSAHDLPSVQHMIKGWLDTRIASMMSCCTTVPSTSFLGHGAEGLGHGGIDQESSTSILQGEIIDEFQNKESNTARLTLCVHTTPGRGTSKIDCLDMLTG